MCKFNSRLFVFTVCCLIGLQAVQVLAKPVEQAAKNGIEDFSGLGDLFALLTPQDLHYDQRQKGEENYRIKLDGFFIGLPQEDSTGLLLLTDDILESLDNEYVLASGKNQPSAESSSSPAILSVASPTTTSYSFDSNENPSPTSENSPSNLQARVMEVSAPKRYLKTRQSMDSGSRTKAYISHFLNLLKRERKY